MTGAFPCIETTHVLRCGRITRPAVDGMVTRCGEERVFTGGTLAAALVKLAREGWAYTGAGLVFCPPHAVHPLPRPPTPS